MQLAGIFQVFMHVGCDLTLDIYVQYQCNTSRHGMHMHMMAYQMPYVSHAIFWHP